MRTLLPLATSALLAVVLASAANAASLRFFGHGGSPGDNFVFPDRVKILVEPPASANVGAGDFTIEFFLRSLSTENTNPAFACGFGIDWVSGNILIDRDRFGQGRKFGIALLGGRIAFGASDASIDYTLCGLTDLRDNAWHHVAVERRASDGRLRIWIDGALDAQGPTSGGPTGDMSYPVSAVPMNNCSPDGGSGSSSCQNSDPYLVFGAEKHGFSGINFSGWLDEVRLSSGLRYLTSFPVPSSAFTPDVTTLALFHFDEGTGTNLGDSVMGGVGGGIGGTLFFGGEAPAGPVWSNDSPFPMAIPSLRTPALFTVTLSFAVVGMWQLRRRPAHALA